MIYDVLILGSGPAGLAASLAFGRGRRTALMISNEQYRNAQANAAHVLVHDGINPNTYRDMCRKQVLEKYNTISFVVANIIQAVSSKDDAVNVGGFPSLYTLTSDTGESFTGRKVIFATGSVDQFPEIPGFRENWPCNIYQGLFCDGWERTGHGSGIGVLALPAHPIYVHMALRAFSFDPPRVVIYTNGTLADDHPMKEALMLAMANGCKVDERAIASLERVSGDTTGIKLNFENDETDTVGFLINKPLTVPAAGDIAKQLGLGTTDVDFFGTIVNRNEPLGSTTAEGVYACGDVAGIGKGAPLSEAHGVVAADAIWGELVQEEAMIGLAKFQEVQKAHLAQPSQNGNIGAAELIA